MPITQIPFQDPVAPPEKSQPEQLELYQQQAWETAYRDLDARIPHLLIQLQDDLQRSRRREAAWISLLVHILLIIFILNLPTIRKYLPFQTVVVLPQNFAKDKGITFLTLPPDEQKVTRKPNTNIASDKDRIATSRRPELDPKELKKLLPSPPPGAPGLRGPNGAQPSPPPQAMMQNPPSIQPQQGAPANQRPQFDSNQTAQLQAPPQPKNSFSKYTQGMSAGSQIQQATQAAAARRSAGGGGQEGDFGLNRGVRGRQMGPAEILSDTQGVDFGPYLQRILQNVRENWYHLIPESVEMKKGKLALEFAIMKDGSVPGITLTDSSGDVALDNPAIGAIKLSTPFPPLPSDFAGQYLSLRFRFYYNPDKADLQ
jgi:TonB family protein